MNNTPIPTVRSLIAETINSQIDTIRRTSGRVRNIAQSPIAAVALLTPRRRHPPLLPSSPPRMRRRRNLLRVRPLRNRRRTNSEPIDGNLTGIQTIDLTNLPTPPPSFLNPMSQLRDTVANGPDALWQNYSNTYYSPERTYEALKREEAKDAQEERQKKLERSKRPRRKRRRQSKEPIYDEDDISCSINGTEDCSNEKLVTFVPCGCSNICRSCAISWLNQSSTCPFCRKEVKQYSEGTKRPRSVKAVMQRGDHDRSMHYYTFEFYNSHNIKIKHDIILQQSYIFANERTKNVSKEILIYLQLISSSLFNRFVMPSDAVLHFVNDILFKKVKNVNVHCNLLVRAATYYALYGQSDYLLGKAMTFLDLIVKKIKEKRINAKTPNPKHLEVNLFDERTIKLSPHVFRAPPLQVLFTKSIANMILHADKANIYRALVIDAITEIEPTLVYVLTVTEEWV